MTGLFPNRRVVGVTATRSGLTEAQRRTAGHILTVLKDFKFGWLVHGCCRGGDVEMDMAARELGYLCWGWPADDSVAESDRLDIPDLDRLELPHSPLWRNVNGILKNAEAMIGLPNSIREKRRGSGTWATIRATRKVEKPLFLIFPSGELVSERTESVCILPK